MCFLDFECIIATSISYFSLQCIYIYISAIIVIRLFELLLLSKVPNTFKKKKKSELSWKHLITRHHQGNEEQFHRESKSVFVKKAMADLVEEDLFFSGFCETVVPTKNLNTM